jgi:hypothetical protein
MGTMIEIVETGNYPLFKQMIKEIGYVPLDSVVNDEIAYLAVDPKEKSNLLTCYTDNNFKAKAISYSTNTEKIYNEMKSQIPSFGYISVMKDSSALDGTTESFKKENLRINLSVTNKGRRKMYNIFFVHFKGMDM